MSLGRLITLNNGVKMPQIGLGTWQSGPNEVEKAVEHAIKTGYRHIDGALVYGNQDEIGRAIKSAGVPREELFLVSKLWNNSHRPERVEGDFELTLKQLDTTYLDLYLIHWPIPFAPGDVLFPFAEDGKSYVIDTEAPSIVETWKALIKIRDSGRVKAIGVSNFPVRLLKLLIDETGVVPAVNQVEAHPGLQQDDLEAFAKEHNIHLTAYSPLGNNVTGRTRIIDYDSVKTMAKNSGREPANILIAWLAYKGYSVIPKSVTPGRIESNFNDVVLTEAEFKEISELGKKEPIRYHIPWLYTPQWPINVFDLPEEQESPIRVW